MNKIKANFHIKGEKKACEEFQSIIYKHIIADSTLHPILIYCSSKKNISKKVVEDYYFKVFYSTSNSLALSNPFFDFYLDKNQSKENLLLNLQSAINLYERCKNERNEQLKNDLAIKGSRIGVWYWNVQTGETCFDERWAEIIGYTLEEISPVTIDTWIKYAHPDDLKKSDMLLKEHFEGKTEYYDFQSRMRHKNNKWVWVHDRGKVFGWDEQGKPVHMCGSHSDITPTKELELKMTNSIQEKDVLLGEIHHRVKNNLQLIQSILRLKSFNEGTVIDMEEVEHTIHALAAAHDAIYHSNDLLKINLKHYFTDILRFIRLDESVLLKVNTVPMVLNINKLIPIGLIVMEAGSNSFKHAFSKSDKKKTITVSVKKTKNKISLNIKDNGKGFADKIKKNKKAYGMEIMKSLAEQIDAKISFKNSRGATITLVFESNKKSDAKV